ncbi:MAG: hypothetical protein OXF27_19355 [Acidobacteria bacterium]|nr:hypothetical protein [Acidobacteriota bacterium]
MDTGRPRRVSEPNAGGDWTTRVVDPPAPQLRVGRGSVPIDHEHLERVGLDERTGEGRRRVVRSALGFAARMGVHVVVPPAEAPRSAGPGAVVVHQAPPREFRSNGEWAGDLMKRVARHFVEDSHEGPRAVECVMLYGLTRSTRADYAGALAQGLGYVREQLRMPTRGRGGAWFPEGVAGDDCRGLQAALVEHVRAGSELWGSSTSPYACARVMTRAHTDKTGSPLLEHTRRLEPAPPDRYGDTVGGWFAWHLAETQPRFREFDPARLAADCDEWLCARAAEDLLQEAGLRSAVDGVRATLSSGAVRGALEALPVPADDPAAYGLIVSHQAMGWNRHPLNRARAELTAVHGVEPVGFRELDSRREDDAVVLEDRVLGVCAGSGVAVRLRDADGVRLFHAPGRGGAAAGGSRPPAQVAHPIPERFASTEDWGRSVLRAVALAVATHPRLYDHARLDALFGRRPEEGARMFEQAARAVSRRYRLDHHDVVARARAFEAPAGQRGGVMSLDDVEDRTGVPAPRVEVARRTFWTALGDASERERLPRAFADEAIATPESDHAMLARVRRAEFSDLPAVVRDCDRVLEQPVGGRWAPGPLVPGVVARAVADVAADRILASIVGGESRMEFGESPTPRARAVLARLEAGRERPDAVLARVAAGHLVGGDRDDARVLDVVVERADAIVDFILDPTRARRSDRVRDVEHSQAANPRADLQAGRARRAGAPDPGKDRHRGPGRARVVEPGR